MTDGKEKPSSSLTHVDAGGRIVMVDVTEKPATVRTATAEARIRMSASTFELVRENRLKKGDLGATVRLAGIQGAKRTSDLIPLCHPIPLESVEVEVLYEAETAVIRATVVTEAKTGVEMEAMTAATVAALAFYDMVKGVERGVVIEKVRLLFKAGGRSGVYRAGE